jgi:TDG/mug DNA glycosylase family protein
VNGDVHAGPGGKVHAGPGGNVHAGPGGNVHAGPGGDVLPDLLAPGLRVVFCGMAAGPESARAGAYYAKPGNRFWAALEEAGFTPRRLRPAEYPHLLGLGIGLTDLAKMQSGVDRVITVSDADRQRLRAAIQWSRPRAVVFTSGEAASRFLGVSGIPFGRLAESLRPLWFPPTHVLPSTSGSNNGNWDRFGYQKIWTDTAMSLGFSPPVAA